MERSLKILLADDEEIVQTTLSGYLQDLGHQVESASDGLQAMKMIEAGDYDLALVDVLMPGMDGLKLLEETQRLRSELPFIIITGDETMDSAIDTLPLGAKGFLAKPLKLLELEEIIKKATCTAHVVEQAIPPDSLDA